MRLQVRPGDTLILDRWLDVAYVALWTIYGAFGLTALIEGFPTIQWFTPDAGMTIWSGLVGVASSVAALAAASVFFTAPPSPETKKQIERAMVKVIIVLLIVLVIASLTEAIFFHRAHSGAVVAFSYLVFPVLRVHILRKKIEAIHAVQNETTDR